MRGNDRTRFAFFEGKTRGQLVKEGLINILPKEEAEKRGIYKNQIAFIYQPNHEVKYQALICKQSSSGDDICVGKAGVDILSKQTDTAYIIMIDCQDIVVETITAKDLSRELSRENPRDGKYGEYWWYGKNNKIGWGHLDG